MDEIDLDYDDDGLDGLGFDDPFGDMEDPFETVDDRTAVAKIKDGAIEELTSFENVATITRTIADNALPRGFSDAKNTIEDGISFGVELYDKSKKELEPALNESKYLINKNIDKVSVLPENVRNTIKSFTTVENKDQVNLGNLDESSIDSSLKFFDGFSPRDRKREARVGHRIDEVRDQIEDARFGISSTLLRQIAIGIEDNNNREQEITVRYQRKMLELTHRQYFASRDILQVMKAFSSDAVGNLRQITKNTALPDIIKSKMSEEYHYMVQQTLIGNLNRTFEEYAGNFVQKLKSNIGDKVSEITGNLNTSLFDINSSAEAINDITGGGDMGMDPYSTAGGVGASMGLNALAGAGARKLRTWAEENPAIAARAMRASWFMDNLPAIANDWAKSESNNPIIDTIKSLVPTFGSEDTSVIGNLRDKGTEAAIFDQLTRRSIIEIIPGFLGKAVKYLADIATGKDNPEMVYSTSKEMFVSRGQEDVSALERALPVEKMRSNADDLIQAISRVDHEGRLNQDERQALFEFFARYASQGKTNIRLEDILEENFADLRNSGSIARKLGNSYTLDGTSEDRLRTEQGSINISNALRRSVSMFDDVNREIGISNSMGEKRYLRDIGIIKKVGEKDVIDRDALFKLYNERGLSDENMASLLEGTDSSFDGIIDRKTKDDMIDTMEKRNRSFFSRFKNREKEFTRMTTVSDEYNPDEKEYGKNFGTNIQQLRELFFIRRQNMDGVPVHIMTGGIDGGDGPTGPMGPILPPSGPSPSPFDSDGSPGAPNSQLFGLVTDIRRYLEEISNNTEKGAVLGAQAADIMAARESGGFDPLGGLTKAVVSGTGSVIKGSAKFIGAYYRGLWKATKWTAGHAGDAIKGTYNYLTNSNETELKGVKTDVWRRLKDTTADLYDPSTGEKLLDKTRMRAGEYFDAVTGKNIRSVGDIQGAIRDNTGNIVVSFEQAKQGLRAEDGDIVIFEKAKNAVQKLFNGAVAVVGASWNAQMAILNKARELSFAAGKGIVDWFNRPIDIYTVESFKSDPPHAKLLASVMRAGGYVTRKGTVVKAPKDIDSDVMDPNTGEVLLSLEEVGKGLYNVSGRKLSDSNWVTRIRSYYGMQWDIVKKMAGFGFKVAGGIYRGMGKGLGAAYKLITSTVDSNQTFGLAEGEGLKLMTTFTDGFGGVNTRLDTIIDILDNYKREAVYSNDNDRQITKDRFPSMEAANDVIGSAYASMANFKSQIENAVTLVDNQPFFSKIEAERSKVFEASNDNEIDNTDDTQDGKLKKYQGKASEFFNAGYQPVNDGLNNLTKIFEASNDNDFEGVNTRLDTIIDILDNYKAGMSEVINRNSQLFGDELSTLTKAFEASNDDEFDLFDSNVGLRIESKLQDIHSFMDHQWGERGKVQSLLEYMQGATTNFTKRILFGTDKVGWGEGFMSALMNTNNSPYTRLEHSVGLIYDYMVSRFGAQQGLPKTFHSFMESGRTLVQKILGAPVKFMKWVGGGIMDFAGSMLGKVTSKLMDVTGITAIKDGFMSFFKKKDVEQTEDQKFRSNLLAALQELRTDIGALGLGMDEAIASINGTTAAVRTMDGNMVERLDAIIAMLSAMNDNTSGPRIDGRRAANDEREGDIFGNRSAANDEYDQQESERSRVKRVANGDLDVVTRARFGRNQTASVINMADFIRNDVAQGISDPIVGSITDMKDTLVEAIRPKGPDFGDGNNDGRRDGGWRDILARRKTTTEDTAGRNDQETEEQPRKRWGWMMPLLAGLGTVFSGAISGLLGAAKWIASAMGAGSILDSFGTGDPDIDRRDSRNRNSRGGRGGRGGRTGTLGKLLNGAKGLASRGVSAIGRAGSALLPKAAGLVRTAAPIAARVGAMAATAVTPFLSTLAAGATAFAVANPITAGVLVAGAVGYGAYKGYKYLSARSKPEGLDLLRYLHYGVDMEADGQLQGVYYLEEALNDTIGWNGNIPVLKEDHQYYLEECGEDFGVETDADAQLWLTWFNKRFLPVYLGHLGSAKAMDIADATDDIEDDIDDNQRTQFITTAFNTASKFGSNPIAVLTSPWPSSSVKDNITAITDYLKPYELRLASDGTIQSDIIGKGISDGKKLLSQGLTALTAAGKKATDFARKSFGDGDFTDMANNIADKATDKGWWSGVADKAKTTAMGAGSFIAGAVGIGQEPDSFFGNLFRKKTATEEAAEMFDDLMSLSKDKLTELRKQFSKGSLSDSEFIDGLKAIADDGNEALKSAYKNVEGSIEDNGKLEGVNKTFDTMSKSFTELMRSAGSIGKRSYFDDMLYKVGIKKTVGDRVSSAVSDANDFVVGMSDRSAAINKRYEAEKAAYEKASRFGGIFTTPEEQMHKGITDGIQDIDQWGRDRGDDILDFGDDLLYKVGIKKTMMQRAKGAISPATEKGKEIIDNVMQYASTIDAPEIKGTALKLIDRYRVGDIDVEELTTQISELSARAKKTAGKVANKSTTQLDSILGSLSESIGDLDFGKTLSILKADLPSTGIKVDLVKDKLKNMSVDEMLAGFKDRGQQAKAAFNGVTKGSTFSARKVLDDITSSDTYEDLKDKGLDYYERAKEYGLDGVERITSSDTYDDSKAAADTLYKKAKRSDFSGVRTIYNRMEGKGEEMVGRLSDADLYRSLKERVEDHYEMAKDYGLDVYDDPKAAADTLYKKAKRIGIKTAADVRALSVEDIVDLTRDYSEKAYDTVVPLSDKVRSAANGYGGDAMKTTTSLYQDASDRFNDLIGPTGQSMLSKASDVVSKYTPIASNAVHGMYTSAANSVSSWFGGAGGKELLDSAVDPSIKDGYVALKSSLVNAKNWALGAISSFFETGGRGAATVSTGRGDHGGASYGTYQLASRTGTLQRFMKTSGYEKDFKGLMPGTAQFNAKWKELATNPATMDAFSKAQHDYIKETHYDPAIAELAKGGILIKNRGPAVLDAIYSTSVQFGPGNINSGSGAAGLISNALAGVDVGSASDEEIVRAIQGYKRDNNDRLFRSSSNQVRASTLKRAGQEEQMLVKLSKSSSSPALADKEMFSGVKGDSNITMPNVIKFPTPAATTRVALTNPVRDSAASKTNSNVINVMQERETMLNSPRTSASQAAAESKMQSDLSGIMQRQLSSMNVAEKQRTQIIDILTRMEENQAALVTLLLANNVGLEPIAEDTPEIQKAKEVAKRITATGSMKVSRGLNTRRSGSA